MVEASHDSKSALRMQRPRLVRAAGFAYSSIAAIRPPRTTASLGPYR
ncbi:hypothetical protein J2S41_003397 [Catenuloplanes atrovinosus]|uniref:Uncharacterized protein n=1 Tax=Catenuloplanes atrovinosus TaxID=137266 RepID=A0AAE3YMQ9_9ACTN|nr:hypothetical protein [Catenuloplanes atrovinosus]